MHAASFFLRADKIFRKLPTPHKRLSRSDVGNDVTVTSVLTDDICRHTASGYIFFYLGELMLILHGIFQIVVFMFRNILLARVNDVDTKIP